MRKEKPSLESRYYTSNKVLSINTKYASLQNYYGTLILDSYLTVRKFYIRHLKNAILIL